MASRGAATACIAIARQRNYHPSLPSRLSFFNFPSNAPLPHIITPHPRSKTEFRCPIRVICEATTATTTRVDDDALTRKKKDEEDSPQNWKIKMLYDGECPLCMREVDMLRERNKSYGTIKFVDISSDEYSPEENQGLDYKTVMGRIHTILSDGTVVTDVEAFRRLYEQVGLEWVFAITKYEPIATIADAIYGVWAKYCLQITGRPPLEQVLEARKKKSELCSNSNACKM